MTTRVPRPVLTISLALLACCSAAVCQQTKATTKPKAPPSIALTVDTLLTLREKQIVGAAEAMPAEKYSFVPDGESFKGSRTFGLEVSHAATVNFALFSAMLGQALPPGISWNGTMNGPDGLQTKDQIVQFLKDSFALGHKAVATITEKNALAPINDPNLPFTQPYLNSRMALASLAVVHATDHYGQIVVYLRMNGITPPASVGKPPANPIVSR